jgi:pyridoxal phosphate enzyme (YggS family)
MSNILENYKNICSHVYKLNKNITIIAVSKNFAMNDIKPLIDNGHIHFGENKVQEAQLKWSQILLSNNLIKLHLVGPLQTNKVDKAVSIFSFIHSLDRVKLADKLKEQEIKQSKKLKYFIQVNIGNEIQKSGVLADDVPSFIDYCIKTLGLDVVGLMCLPPANEKPDTFFKILKNLSDSNKLIELSMGMSNDYETAIKYGATYIRVGSAIFN